MTNLIKPPLTASQLELAFESIGEGAMIVDIHGRVLRANSIALSLLGYKEDELIGQWLVDKVTALNVEHKIIRPINRPLIRAMITGRPVYEYLYFHGHNRSHLPVFVSVSPILDSDGLIGAMEVFRDISMEEAVDQMKSEFISLASHQLRTPLSSIKTYSHMLIDGYMGKIDDQKKQALEIIVASTNRMNELISTLLNITRLESGAIVVQKGNIDIAQIAREVIEEMAIPAKSSLVKLRLKISGKYSTRIRSDGPIIKEVITNLVSNSVKYSKKYGQVDLGVISNKTSLTVVVSDNGLGIPGRAQAQIFSKFFRGHNVIERETNGTGLGLYLVKGLVRELGGKITFQSEEGKGTVFRVRLPRKITAK